MSGNADAFLNHTLNGRYVIRGHISDGNFSHVFSAEDTTTGGTVAIKLLSPFRASLDPHCVQEFDNEALLLSVLANAANIVDFGGSHIDTLQVEFPPGAGNIVDLTVRFLVLELADNALDEVMVRRNAFDWPTRLRLYRHVVAAVHQMHLTKVVHRDIKSANGLMFATATTQPVVKLGDLGRSRDCGAASSMSPAAYVMGRGDPSFAPPEFFWHLGVDNSVSFRRADLYMLGSILFEFATGQGITAVALPDWLSIANQATTLSEADRPKEFKARIGGLRSRYKAALDLLESELPAPIRVSGVELVKQLCDPDPAAREHRLRAERKTPDWGLEWVFRRVDILSKSLSVSQASGYRRGKKAG